MENKYEQIVLQEFNRGGKPEAGLFQSVMGNLVSAFSDTGALGAFTDILTGDRTAKQYTADPVGQRIYQSFVQPAVSSAKNGDLESSFDQLNQGFDKIRFYIGSYKLNLRKYLNDPKLRDTVDKGEGYAWYPEQVIGMPMSRAFSRLSALGKNGYDRFPIAVEFQDSIKQGIGALCSGAQIIIGMRIDDILADPDLAQQVYIGLGRIMQNLQSISAIAFSIRSAYRTYTTFDAEFDLSDLVSDLNKDNQNVVHDLTEFMNLIEGVSKAMSKVSQQNDSKNQSVDDSIDLDRVTNEVLKKLSELAQGEPVKLILRDEDLGEQSVVGSIAGYSLPLGTSNQDDPDKEMDDELKGKKSDSAYKWDDLEVSTANVGDEHKESFEKGSDFIFKGRKP